MKRNLVVSSQKQAKEMIEAFLKANVLPVHENMEILFGWFARDLEDDDEVGCPCFVYEMGNFISRQGQEVNILIYVKIFANKDLNVTKLYQISQEKRMFFDEISDGEAFDMVDKMSRYQNQRFIYKDGKISEVK